MYSILRRLDQRRFLGLPIWEFSFRSLPRRYGRLFLRDIVLRHPLRTIKGLLAYRQLTWGGGEGGILQPSIGTERELRDEILEGEGEFMVALGFCQKSLGCPAGRFNHECHVLPRDDLLGVEVGGLPSPCRDCDIRVIGTAALEAGAAVYIMTSAVDVARHLFIPVLEDGQFRHGLFLLCPYSIPAMTLPLLICDLRSLLIGYSDGDCRDYPQFILADEGTKDERTCLSPPAQAATLNLLGDVALARQAGGRCCRRFQQGGSIYLSTSETRVPDSSSGPVT